MGTTTTLNFSTFEPSNYFGSLLRYYVASEVEAFGSLLPGRNYSSSSYKYGFNEQEKDDEVKGSGCQYDYGFRIYDPRIARFLSVDPLAASYPWYTPYQFAGNKPIIAIDLDGLEEYIVINVYGKGGKLLSSKITKTTQAGTIIDENYTTSNGVNHSKGVLVFNYRDDGSMDISFQDGGLNAEQSKAITKMTRIGKKGGAQTSYKTLGGKMYTGEIERWEASVPLPSKPIIKPIVSGPISTTPTSTTSESGTSTSDNDDTHGPVIADPDPESAKQLDMTFLCWDCWVGRRVEHWNDGVNAVVDFLSKNPDYNVLVTSGGGNASSPTWTPEDKLKIIKRYNKLGDDVSTKSGGKFGRGNLRFSPADVDTRKIDVAPAPKK